MRPVEDFTQTRASLVMRRDGNSPFLESLSTPTGFGRGGRPSPSRRVAKEPERSLRGYAWIELPQTSRRRVSRVCEYRFSCPNALFVHSLEGVEWQVHFTTNFDAAFRRLPRQPEWNVANGSKILCDDLTYQPIPARRPFTKFRLRTELTAVPRSSSTGNRLRDLVTGGVRDSPTRFPRIGRTVRARALAGCVYSWRVTLNRARLSPWRVGVFSSDVILVAGSSRKSSSSSLSRSWAVADVDSSQAR